ncbi:Nramp family divalent metal transporter [Aeoliella mucimassa]|uniref:Nramp family divalent metal transporter n=1 Tax=Aeoliella mucimassa TaxID=2527972 RepID=UPI0018D3CFEE|nr:Nramp family divalent metal transporter [Aeoliella mucimassa]
MRNLFRSLGPAIIVASIVLGPGSILTSSKVGCQYGYELLWVLAAAVVLMMGMTALAAHIGVINERTICDEAAARWGRPVAIAIGLVVFLIVACFQTVNNVAVVAALEGLWQDPSKSSSPTMSGQLAKVSAVVVLNGVVISAMYGLRKLYRPLEKLMMVLVFSMLIAFTINLLAARPSVEGIAGGLVPSLPSQADTSQNRHENLLALLGLVATTFSVAGAFYQSYLVKEKGWDADDTRKGLRDAVVGIGVLGVVSALIMSTSAAALHGVVAPESLKNTSDIARQLEPLFGSAAGLLFSIGVFAAAFSSFLGNALIGGTVLSDGLGWGASIEQPWPKRLTTIALGIGMAIAIGSVLLDANPVRVIVFAQALTVVGAPALAFLLIYLGMQAKAASGARLSWGVMTIPWLGGIVTLLLAGRTVYQLWLQANT